MTQDNAEPEIIVPPPLQVAPLSIRHHLAHSSAIITRGLSPGQWAYSSDILEQEKLFKQSKRQFQQSHEPISGREVIWAIKLLLTTA